MPPRKQRYSRSRKGCQQCRQVGLKCDETLPVCDRCRRLNKPCDYSQVLVWREKNAQKLSSFSKVGARLQADQSSAQSLAEDEAPPELSCSLDNYQRDNFVRRSQKLLHWTGISNNCVLSKIGPLSNEVPAIKNGIIALEQIHRGSPLLTLRSINRAILSVKAELSKDSTLQQIETVSACAFLIIHLSMRAGYHWTHQLPGLLSLVTAKTSDHIIIEQIAGLDMNVWILGRQSEAQHIWRHHCMERSGYESITGLPRSFLDLVARVSLLENVVIDLDAYISGVRKDRTVKADIVLAFALSLRLYLHNHVQLQQDFAVTVDSLSTIVSGLWDSHQDDSNFNERIFIWPTYMICCTTQDSHQYDQAKRLLLKILESSSGVFFQDPLLRIMNIYWNRKENSEPASPDSIARELEIEVGIW